MRGLLFKFFMWLNRKDQCIYDDGYSHGWDSAVDAVRTGELVIVPLSGTTDKRLAYPIHVPAQQERITDRIQRPGQFGVAVHQAMQQGAGMDTAISRAIPRRPYPTVKLSPDRDRR